MTENKTPAPSCAECGPGYRIGDEGCRHGAAALLATRDALASILCRQAHGHGRGPDSRPPCKFCRADVDAFFASGAVQTPAEWAAGLADDEALRHRLADKIALAYEGEGEAWPGGDRLAQVAADIAARHFAGALAADLAEQEAQR